MGRNALKDPMAKRNRGRIAAAIFGTTRMSTGLLK